MGLYRAIRGLRIAEAAAVSAIRRLFRAGEAGAIREAFGNLANARQAAGVAVAVGGESAVSTVVLSKGVEPQKAISPSTFGSFSWDAVRRFQTRCR